MNTHSYDPNQDMALAESHIAAGRLAESETVLRRILDNLPDFHPAYHLLGLIAFAGGNLPLAVELVAKALSLDNSVALYHRNLGEMCRRLGRLDVAVKAARRATELSPEDLNAHYNLGLALSDQCEWAAATGAYQAALALNPGHGPSLNNLGSAQKMLGNLADAEAAFTYAVQLNPHHKEALINLQTIFQQQGRLDEARQCLDAANAIDQQSAVPLKQPEQRASVPVYPPDVRVMDTGTKRGRGVFAQRDFTEGETVEISPVVIFETPFSSFPAELRTIVFSWGMLCGSGHSHAVSLGYGSLYNHNDPANMRYEPDPENRLMKYIAVRNIVAGEELSINYNAKGGGATWGDSNWFDRMQITPILSE